MIEEQDEACGSEDEGDLDELLLAALKAVPAHRKRQVLRYLRFVSGEEQRQPCEP